VKETADYSGQFDPDFSHDRFSKKTLLELLKAYSEYMLRIDGHWYLTVMKKWSNDEAFECDIKVWEKAQLFETRTISGLLGIQGDDVATVMKSIQVSPWMWMYEYEIDLISNDHAIVTNFTCPTLFSLEKEGTGRERQICQEMEPRLMETIAHYFNPKIKVTPLKIPPRTDYSDCCCKWEFKLER
jgi:hypothetical protein